MYFNVSFYAQVPFSDLTTKQLKLKMKNNLSYLLRTYNAILRLVHFRWSLLTLFVEVPLEPSRMFWKVQAIFFYSWSHRANLRTRE